jgi:hypothetical protein
MGLSYMARDYSSVSVNYQEMHIFLKKEDRGRDRW